MGELVDRLKRIITLTNQLIKTASQQLTEDPAADANGGLSHSLYLDLRFLAIAKYVHSGDADAFRKLMRRAIDTRAALWERARKGEPISRSLLSLTDFSLMSESLMVGDEKVVNRVTELMGKDRELEERETHPHTRRMAECFKVFIQQLSSSYQQTVDNLRTETLKKANRAFEGYVRAFSAIADRNEAELSGALGDIVEV